MKLFTENEKNENNVENGENDKINRLRIEQVSSYYNHQQRVEHIDKTVAQFNAMFARLKASKKGDIK